MSGSPLAEINFRGLSHGKFLSAKALRQLSQGERYETITIHIVQKYEFYRYAKYPTFQFKHGT